jgi:hypothetical protein
MGLALTECKRQGAGGDGERWPGLVWLLMADEVDPASPDGQRLSEITRRELGPVMLWALRLVLASVSLVVLAFVVHALVG